EAAGPAQGPGRPGRAAARDEHALLGGGAGPGGVRRRCPRPRRRSGPAAPRVWQPDQERGRSVAAWRRPRPDRGAPPCRQGARPGARPRRRDSSAARRRAAPALPGNDEAAGVRARAPDRAEDRPRAWRDAGARAARRPRRAGGGGAAAAGAIAVSRRILLVDDDPAVLRGVSGLLRDEGYRTETAATAAEAHEAILRDPPAAILLDVQLPGESGLSLLARLPRPLPAPVVVLSGGATPGEAAQALKLGATDFVEKPPAAERLLTALQNALALRELEEERERLREELAQPGHLVGESAAMAE